MQRSEIANGTDISVELQTSGGLCFDPLDFVSISVWGRRVEPFSCLSSFEPPWTEIVRFDSFPAV